MHTMLQCSFLKTVVQQQCKVQHSQTDREKCCLHTLWSYSLCRVPTPPGKSWNCVCKISITWKVLENKFGHLHYTIRLLADLAYYRQIWRHPGPGKWVWSWKVLEFARQWCRRYNMCVHTPLLCSSSFFAIPSQHVTVMNSMNAAIIYIYKRISSKFLPQKLKNGFAAGNARWRAHSVTPPDEHRLCPMSIRALC